MIIHLHEVLVNPEPDTPGKKAAPRPVQRGIMRKEDERLRYALGSEAWAALQVFSSGYCNTDVYQLPLYQGAPSQVQTSSHQRPNGIQMQLSRVPSCFSVAPWG